MISKDTPIGTKVYTIESWSERIVKAKIEEICVENIENGRTYAKLKGLYDCDNDEDTDAYGSWGCFLENLYLTKEEVLIARDEENKKEILKYKSQIKDINDLINFCLSHCIANGEEYTNWNARKAVIEKAKEFGIKIK